ncbi:DUF2147 domain-containing protein [Methylobacterium durans]|uniref:DUF2147 domain-containing protein n=1 Tax=Methylobacterium durans TaxID=2202825 RepID=A0A2U8WC10_9HYPH|nr:DUF2147 domain-containing protein [Methylobacterium durans]AWN42856.1 DUF2147 domain-containing protein [Methylobacterium durans]
MTLIHVRFTTAALFAAAALVSSHCHAAPAVVPAGTWLTEDGRARVRTEPCGSDATRLCGFIVWGSKPLDENGKPKVDRYNPDPAKQARPQLGHQMLLGLRTNSDGRFEGKIYNAEDGKSYDVTVWSDQSATLTVKGCMLVFCASQAWKRVADVAHGQLQGATDAAGGPRSDPEWAAKGAVTGSVPARRAPPTDGSPTRVK